MGPEEQSMRAELGVAYCLFSLALSTTLARLYTRTYVLRQFGVDDLLVTIGMILGIVALSLYHVMTSDYILLLKISGGNGSAPITLRTLPFLEKAIKIQYILSVFYPAQNAVLKLSILAFYRRFLPPKPYHIVLLIVAVCTVLFAVAASLATLLQCLPIAEAWTIGGTKRSCPVNVSAVHVSLGAFNLLTDLIILILPIPVVIKLRMDQKRKIGLMVLFSVGLGGTAATAVRLWKTIELAKMFSIVLLESFFTGPTIIMWSQIELNTIVICANLPALSAGLRRRREPHRRAYEPGLSLRSPRPLELTRQKGSGLAVSATRKSLSSSEEGIIDPHYHDIIRSTTVMVEVEDMEQAKSEGR